MRGPVRTLGFDARFDEAVGLEQANPGAAAFTFADIADRLSAAGYGGHADALRPDDWPPRRKERQARRR